MTWTESPIIRTLQPDHEPSWNGPGSVLSTESISQFVKQRACCGRTSFSFIVALGADGDGLDSSYRSQPFD